MTASWWLVIDIGGHAAGRRLQRGDGMATGRQQRYVAPTRLAPALPNSSPPATRPPSPPSLRPPHPPTAEVLDEGRAVALGGSKQRALLAVLLLHANETLSTDRLIEELWGEHAPATAAKTVQVHVSRLRKALAAGAT